MVNIRIPQVAMRVCHTTLIARISVAGQTISMWLLLFFKLVSVDLISSACLDESLYPTCMLSSC